LKTPLTAKDLESLHDQAFPKFQKKWESGSENERYLKIENWSEEQKRKINLQGRLAYSFPIAMTKINTILATQKQARTQFDVKAKADPNDEPKAELAKLMLRDDERSSKFQYIESEVFASGVAVQYGAAEAYVDYSDILPKIRFRKLDYKNVIWDANSTDYLLEDALWVAKIDRMYRFQFEREYPEAKDISESNSHIGREKASYYVKYDPNGRNEYDIISVFTHYQKVSRKCFYVVHPNPMGFLGDGIYIKKFRSKKEAEQHLREINIPYVLNGMGKLGTIEVKYDISYDRYKFADSKIVEWEETDYPSFPIKVYRSFQFEDDWWCFMDFLKSPQKFYDRLLAQTDYSLGSDIKTVYQLNVNALAEGTTFENAKRIIEQTGGVVPSNSSEPILQAVRAQGVNPQWLQIAGIVQSLIEDFAGGRSFSGLQDSAGESGRAIALKKQQGALVAFLMLDNLSRWKQSLGEIALYLHQKYDTVEKQIKVQGNDLTPEMLEILKQNGLVVPSKAEYDTYYARIGIDFLKDADLELTVTEAALTTSEKESQYLQLLEMGRANPTLYQQPAYLMMLLEYQPNIDMKLKKQLIQGIQEQAQRQADFEQQKLNIDKASILASSLNAQIQSNARRNNGTSTGNSQQPS
jgi:hypothetical protein